MAEVVLFHYALGLTPRRRRLRRRPARCRAYGAYARPVRRNLDVDQGGDGRIAAQLLQAAGTMGPDAPDRYA